MEADPSSSAFIVSTGIFVIIFFLIITERLHRTVIGFVGALFMVIAGMAVGFYTPTEAVLSIDFPTIGLLLGMMIIVAILERTGAFQYLGIVTAQKTGGKPWLLMVGLGAITSVLSMFLDNVTTLILIAPITIIIARKLAINAAPLLIAEALLSNIGGAATLVGDPPNVMIASAADLTFNDFLMHSLPVVLVAWFAVLAVLRFVYRDELNATPQHVDELRQMNARDSIQEPGTLRKIVIVLVGVVVLFLLHGVLHISPAFVALLGAAMALLAVTPKHDPQKILENVELSILLFFASLFVIVGGLEEAGVLAYLAQLITEGAAENPVLIAIVILWASAILSAVVDNIPFTVAMLPILATLEANGVNVSMLWWALVFGVGFGGNGSPIGATANVVAISKSEETDTPITARAWLKSGTATMGAALIVATIILATVPGYFTDSAETLQSSAEAATAEAATASTN